MHLHQNRLNHMLLNYGKRQIRNIPFFSVMEMLRDGGGYKREGERGRRGRRETEEGITRCLQTRQQGREREEAILVSASLSVIYFIFILIYSKKLPLSLEYECFENKA